MKELIIAIVFIGLPMALAYWGYRIIDKSAGVTAKLTKKLPVLIKYKFLIQIGGMFGFVLVFGSICLVAGIPKELFYTFSGLIVGFINAIGAGIMDNE